MRSLVIALLCAGLSAGAVGLSAQQARTPAGQTYRAIATVKDIMEGLLEPATETIFDSVSSTVLPDGSREKIPATDEEWGAIRQAALVMGEAGNLLQMRGRLVDVVPSEARARAAAERLTNIATRVAKQRREWDRLARGLFEASAVTRRAVEARDPDALVAAGNAIDAACEACHHKFWYPEGR